MIKFINKKNIKFRSLQFVILLAHLALLKWILYTLYEGGVLPFNTLLFHFLGISISGALLIRVCAFIYQKAYEKELKNQVSDSKEK